MTAKRSSGPTTMAPSSASARQPALPTRNVTRSILLVLLAVSAATGQLREVAYLKASNAETNDHFGNGGTLEGKGVALSGDGRTLAVSAPYESSGAKGVNGKQDDNSVYSSGAVYIF